MHSPAQGPVRLLRAGSLAATVLGVSASAHVLGGGALPPLVVVGGLGAASLAACLVATRRRLSPLGVLALLAGSQVALHEAFMLLAPPMATAMSVDGMTTAPGRVAGAAVLHTALHASAAGSGPGGWPHAMVALHLAATALLAGVHARGERALWALWTWLLPLVVLLAHPRPLPVDRSGAVVVVAAVPRHRRELLAAVPRRGPPAVPVG